MSRLAALLSFAFASAILIGTAYSASFEPPQWAFGAGEKGKHYPDDKQPKRLTGSLRAYTFTQIEDSFAPADWYPEDHPPMPRLPVATGFVAYVLAGAIKRGNDYVATDGGTVVNGKVATTGKVVACTECH